VLHEAGAPKSKRFLRFAVLVSAMLFGLIVAVVGQRWCGSGGRWSGGLGFPAKSKLMEDWVVEGGSLEGYGGYEGDYEVMG